MLVLSRKLGEEIVLPNIGVTITLVRIQRNRAVLGIRAPESVAIQRRELLARKPNTSQGQKEKSNHAVP